MYIDWKVYCDDVYIRKAKNGELTIASFKLEIPTTVRVGNETRVDTIFASLMGNSAWAWNGYKGYLRIAGDFRINRYQKDGIWMTKPEIAITDITKVDNDG